MAIYESYNISLNSLYVHDIEVENLPIISIIISRNSFTKQIIQITNSIFINNTMETTE